MSWSMIKGDMRAMLPMLDDEDAGVVDVANYRIKHWEDQRG